MTLEEKLTYMQTVSMEQARAEGNAIIDAHREALEKIFSDHKFRDDAAGGNAHKSRDDKCKTDSKSGIGKVSAGD